MRGSGSLRLACAMDLGCDMIDRLFITFRLTWSGLPALLARGRCSLVREGCQGSVVLENGER